MPNSISISSDAVEIDGFVLRAQPDLDYLVTLFGSNFRTVDSGLISWIWDDLGISAVSVYVSQRELKPSPTVAANIGVTLLTTPKNSSNPTAAYAGELSVCGVKREKTEPARAYLRRVFLSLQQLALQPVHPDKARPRKIHHISGDPKTHHTGVLELFDPGAADDSTDSGIEITFYFSTPATSTPLATLPPAPISPTSTAESRTRHERQRPITEPVTVRRSGLEIASDETIRMFTRWFWRRGFALLLLLVALFIVYVLIFR